MKLHELAPNPGSKKDRNRVGRGIGSGNGKTSGRGHKGQKARSGGGVRPGFEGGQMPLYRRLPKRGFKNIWAKKYVSINLRTLEEKFESGETVDEATLREKNIVKGQFDGIRILGDVDEEKGFTKNLTVKATHVTKSAEEKIKAVGGSVELIPVKKFVNPPKKYAQENPGVS